MLQWIQKAITAVNTFITKYIKYLPTLLIGIAAIVLFFTIKGCRDNKKEAENWKAKNDYQTQQTTYYKNKVGQQIAEQVVAQTNDKKYIKQLSDSIFNLKSTVKQVQALVRAKQEVSIKNSYIPFSKTDTPKINTVKDTSGKYLVDVDSVIIPPRHFDVDDKYYSIHGTVFLKGITFDSLKLYNTISFRIVEVKPSIFRAEQLKVQAINSNPYFQTDGLNSIILKPKVSEWNSWIKPVLVGLGAAFLEHNLSK